MSRRTLQNLGEGALQKFSDRVERDGVSGLTGEVEFHGHNGPKIIKLFKVDTFLFPVASI